MRMLKLWRDLLNGDSLIFICVNLSIIFLPMVILIFMGLDIMALLYSILSFLGLFTISLLAIFKIGFNIDKK
jgi:hypothetical protein